MTAYDPELTDDEWREANFTDEKLASATHTGGKQPTADELIRAARKYGKEGILDAAILLPQRQYQKVEKALKSL